MNPGLILLYGYPLYLYIGILTFLSLIATATLGMFYIKGKFGVKFTWHRGMAVLTIILAVIHGILVAFVYLP